MAPGRSGRAVIFATAALWAASAPGSPTYTSDVAPILQRSCVGCHSENTRMGDLVLVTRESIGRGGTRGPAVVPGDPESSPLFLMVAGRLDPRMPFSAEPLGAAEVEVLRRWIEAGAPGPEGHDDQPLSVQPGRLPPIKPTADVSHQIFSVAYHPDGRLLALGRHGGVALADADTGAAVTFLDGLSDIARTVAFSPDGTFVAAGGGPPQQYGQIKVWQVADGREAAAIEGHTDTVQALAFSPDGDSLATASYDKDIKLWDLATGAELRTLSDHIDAVYALAFTPDGTRLLSGSADRSVKVWDPLTGERLYTLSDPTDGINSIAIHPSGKRVAAGGQDRTIRVWELDEDGGRLVNVLIAHQSPILRIAYAPDGNRIVTSAADRTVKVFAADTLQEIATLDSQSDWVMSLAFSGDGDRLAAGRYDGSLSIYKTDNYKDLLSVNEKVRGSQ
ncbi:MAG: hypothetical protein OXN89_16040 [Bryobacterales bacterium]|nr:hypothetical protein [Bryobacterales bacterium]